MSSLPFRRIVVIGIGLIGGSVAACLKNIDRDVVVLGIDSEPTTCGRAMELGIVDDAAPIGDVRVDQWLSSGGSDVVILATPARFVPDWLTKMGEGGYDGVVTDVVSTKSGVVKAARVHLGSAARFVGGHPMAGSERSGVEAARADLFHGAYWLLTPAGETDADAYMGVHALVSALGARVVTVEPKIHDEAVAIVSHVPHVAAAALCDVAGAHAGEGGELLRLAAGGFKDTTRIAAGSPELWTGICLDNADALASGLRELRMSLGEFEAMVRAKDALAISSWLERAALVRQSLPAQWVPATRDLFELTVPMVDRPGVVAEVTATVSRAACNIEAIDIDHETEDTALLVLVLTDEGDHQSLMRELTGLGYDPRLRPLNAAAADESAQ